MNADVQHGRNQQDEMNTVDYQMQEIHNVQLGLLKELKRICDQNHIRYYLACGTCLGAVRHKGFIPWDHDVDVFMYYSDLQKLFKVRHQFSEDFFLQGRETDPEFNYSIFRLRDSRTTMIEKCNQQLDINHGFCIDIYPLYFFPENKLLQHYNILASYLYRTYIAGRAPLNHGNLMKLGANVALWLTKGEKREKKIRQLRHELVKYKDGKYVLTYFGLDITPTSAIVYEKSWFEAPSELMFEGIRFSGPTNYDAYLKCKYGDYMELPPIEKRCTQMDDLVYTDIHTSYLMYKGKYYLND